MKPQYTSTYSARVLLIALYPSGSDSATQKPIRLVPNLLGFDIYLIPLFVHLAYLLEIKPGLFYDCVHDF